MSELESRHHEHDYEDPDTNVVSVLILLIVPTILVGFIIRNCYLSKKRRTQYRERRLNVLTAQGAQLRDERGLKEKTRKERMKDIEKALIVKTASKCKCITSLSTKEDIDSISDLTLRTNSTGEMSLSSSNHDIENPAIVENSSSISGTITDALADALADEAACSQTCAICLEQFVGGKDKVSWSKFQTCCHAFHHKCIGGWLVEMKNKDGSCPCCRGPYLEERLKCSDAESNTEGERLDNATVQAPDEESIVGGESLNVTNVLPSDEESNVGSGVAAVLASDEERNADEERSININMQTSDEESNAGGAVTSAMLEEDSLKKTKRNAVGSAEFTSFCIVHGLQKDDN